MFSLAPASPGSKGNIIKSAAKSQQTKVQLDGHYLKVIPKALFDSPIPNNLLQLDLSNNCLEALPDEIGLLVNLYQLDLDGNRIVELPNSFSQLLNLKYLELSRNKLKRIDFCINALKKLKVVNLSGNQLLEIPVYLLSLPNLQKVFCVGNDHLRNIPKSVAIEGLQSMRDYLNVVVEAYEPQPSDEVCSHNCSTTTISDEIKLVLEKKRRTCSQEDFAFHNGFCKYCGRSGNELKDAPRDNACTQTDIEWYRSCGIYPPAEGPLFNDLKDYKSSKRELDSSENHNSRHDLGSQSDVIERLSKLFREQISLVGEERTRILLLKNKRTLCGSHCTHQTQKQFSDNCFSCGLVKNIHSSSEYGSMTEESKEENYEMNDLEYFSDDNSCCSITGNTSELELWTDDESCISDVVTSDLSSRSDIEKPDEPSWKENLTDTKYLTANKELVMIKNGAKAVIPEFILSGHTHSEFSIQFLENASFQPDISTCSVIASPIIQALPHGAKFFSSSPAIVSIPLFVALDADDEVICMLSDTGPNEPVCWQEVPSDLVSLVGDSALVKTTHFSMFCAVVVKSYPKLEKDISVREGGVLEDDTIADGVSVYFPPNSLTMDIKATVEVLYYDKFYVPEYERGGRALASPVVALGPSGITFEKEVEVTIPLPNGEHVINKFGEIGLTVLYSQSDKGEKPNWQVLDTSYTLRKTADGPYVVSFFVKHFTVFEILWNILDSAIPDHMKLYASSYVPNFSFWVFFQALMTECHHNKQFGICVVCCRPGNPMEGLSQYPIEIGACKPRRIKSGELEIRLKSGLFRADADAGEAENGLMKTENFTGREFDKQFACIFNDTVIDKGLLGLVEVRQQSENESSMVLFSFNMIKSAKRKMLKTGQEPSQWETKLFQELAGILSVDDHLWQDFALALGYNRYEIREKFGIAEDRMQEILIDYKTCRNGDPEDFAQALMRVARTHKLVPLDQMMENRQNRRAEHAQGGSSGQRSRSPKYCKCPTTPPKPSQGTKRNFEVSDDPLTDAQLDDIAQKIAKSWKPVGRKLMLSDPDLREIEMNYQNAGENERAFQMLTTWRERYPDDCNMQVLYDALHRSGLRHTANECSRF